MPAEAILRSTCDRCGKTHEASYSKNVTSHIPEGWDRWSRQNTHPLLICPACTEEVEALIAAPLTHVGWVSVSGSGLRFTGLASTAGRDGYGTKVYALGSVMPRVCREEAHVCAEGQAVVNGRVVEWIGHTDPRLWPEPEEARRPDPALVAVVREVLDGN